ncbi:unnamed protein product, partial [marine sediment metagenome]
VDFFTPIVDSPYLFGQIAAANALSDVYAMGGKPITALCLVAFSPKLGHKVLEEILKGGRDKIEESGAVVVGGHSLEDREPKPVISVQAFTPTSIMTSDAFLFRVLALSIASIISSSVIISPFNAVAKTG